MAKEAILTSDNVMKRRITFCSSLKGISWIMPRRVTETLMSWEEEGVHANDRSRWRIIPSAIWWAIWKKRNSRCFESIVNNVQKLYSNDTIFIIDVLDTI
ncbi:hypothetical protein H5410_062236 [Solanum commersonii]|uniref:Uncharacterized protein n=1 Tax=Solanum commersonii TaxID=4109 RepID=A0A9J5WC12_SOLCO|nr:hypothetical protein H5410_062236 [Solanum commersonii]